MKKGFTLIELLVAVIIIGVLTRIALPQYRRVVDKARVAEAQTMLRTLYDSSERLAVEFGAKDYDSLYKSSRRPRAIIARMDMFDQSSDALRPGFACQVKNFRVLCKHWTYSLVTANHDTSYVMAKEVEGDVIVALERSSMKWLCHPIHGERGLQKCLAFDIKIDPSFTGGIFDESADDTTFNG